MKKFSISQLRNEFQRVQKMMKILVARTLNKIVLVLILTPSLAVDARSLGQGPPIPYWSGPDVHARTG